MPRAIASASAINHRLHQRDETPAQPSPLRYFYHGEGVGLKVPRPPIPADPAFHRHMMPKCRKDFRAKPAQIRG
jgi:hypothetical protein